MKKVTMFPREISREQMIGIGEVRGEGVGNVQSCM